MYKRIISFILIFAIVLSLLCVPVFADEIVSSPSFWEWVIDNVSTDVFGDGWVSNAVSAALTENNCAMSPDGYHHCSTSDISGFGSDGYVCVCSYCGSTFCATEDDVHTSYDTAVDALPSANFDSNGSFFIPIPLTTIPSMYGSSCVVTSINPINFVTTSGTAGWTSTAFRMVDQTSPLYYFPYAIIVPYSGSYTLGFVGSTHNCSCIYGRTAGAFVAAAGDVINLCAANGYPITFVKTDTNAVSFGASGYYGMWCSPTDITGVDPYSVDTRPTGITAPVATLNTDNTYTVINNTTIVNEVNNTVTCPGTDSPTTYNSYTYDYSTRTYNFVTDGDNITVTYGDENITYQEGDTTYIYYYYVQPTDPGGDDPGGDDLGGDVVDDDSTIIQWLQKIYNKLITYIDPDGDGEPGSDDDNNFIDDDDETNPDGSGGYDYNETTLDQDNTNILKELGAFFKKIFLGFIKGILKVADFILGFFENLFSAPVTFVSSVAPCFAFLNASSNNGYTSSYTVSIDAMSDPAFAALLSVAEAQIGYPYVWGGSAPCHGGFDCSGLVCYCLNQSGVYSIARTTAQGLHDASTIIGSDDAQPGDIAFFKNTGGDSADITHCAIYVGDGMVIHAGDPVGYCNINTPYWQGRLVCYGRFDYNDPTEATT